MSIDIEALLSTFLRGQSAVTDLVQDRVYTDLPHDRVWPAVLIVRTGGDSIYKSWLESIEVDILAYGGTHKAAFNLAQTCLRSMATALVGAHPEGVVTRVRAGSIAYEPDPDSADAQGHARPRYTVSVAVTAHP